MGVSSIGSTGDWPDLFSWEAAAQNSSDSQEVAVMQDEVHTSGCTFEGFLGTPDIIVSGEVAQDGYFSGGPRFEWSSGFDILRMNQTDLNITVRDLSFLCTAGFFGRAFFDQNQNRGGDVVSFDFINCMFSGTDGFGNSGLTLEARSTTPVSISLDNCVFYGHSGEGHAIQLGYGGGPRVNYTIVARGCTFHDYENEVNLENGSSEVNLHFSGCLLDPNAANDDLTIGGSFSGTTINTSSSYNITSDSSDNHNTNWDTVTGTSAAISFNTTGAPAANEVSWVNAPSDFRLVDDSNNLAIDFVQTAGLATDIVGTSRGSTWDAGAFEIVSTSTDTPIDLLITPINLYN